MADARVIWGGDSSVLEIRKSPLKSGAPDITFPDRKSAAIMDGEYVSLSPSIKRDFYNDTFITDQNACTSPSVILWRRADEELKAAFWKEFGKYVRERYSISPVLASGKWTSAMYLAATGLISKIEWVDNTILRCKASGPLPEILGHLAPGGLFVESEAPLADLMCERLQSVSLYAGRWPESTDGVFSPGGEMQLPDGRWPESADGMRIALPGHSLDFSHIWDGKDLMRELSV